MENEGGVEETIEERSERVRKGRKRWRKGRRREEEYEERNRKKEEKEVEGRVRRTIEVWKEMLGKRREKMKEVARIRRRRVRGRMGKISKEGKKEGVGKGNEGMKDILCRRRGKMWELG